MIFYPDSNLKKLWKPTLYYTNTTNIKASDEKLYLYPEGNAEYERELKITFECEFDFTELPRDSYSCATIVYVHGMAAEITDFKSPETPNKGKLQFVAEGGRIID